MLGRPERARAELAVITTSLADGRTGQELRVLTPRHRRLCSCGAGVPRRRRRSGAQPRGVCIGGSPPAVRLPSPRVGRAGASRWPESARARQRAGPASRRAGAGGVGLLSALGVLCVRAPLFDLHHARRPGVPACEPRLAAAGLNRLVAWPPGTRDARCLLRRTGSCPQRLPRRGGSSRWARRFTPTAQLAGQAGGPARRPTCRRSESDPPAIHRRDRRPASTTATGKASAPACSTDRADLRKAARRSLPRLADMRNGPRRRGDKALQNLKVASPACAGWSCRGRRAGGTRCMSSRGR